MIRSMLQIDSFAAQSLDVYKFLSTMDVRLCTSIEFNQVLFRRKISDQEKLGKISSDRAVALFLFHA